MNLWRCRSCGTENPKASKFCQTCGRKPDENRNKTLAVTTHVTTPLIKQNQKVDEFFGIASSRFVEGDFSGIVFFGDCIRVISCIAMVLGIGIFLYTWAEVSFWTGFIYLISFMLASVPGILVPLFIQYLLELKRDTIQAAKSSYVSAKMLQEILDTLKSIEKNNCSEK